MGWLIHILSFILSPVDEVSEVEEEGWCECPHCNEVVAFTTYRVDDNHTLLGYRTQNISNRRMVTSPAGLVVRTLWQVGS